MPSSHMSGRRYFNENFHDGIAICRVHDAPDVFTTFTCNPKWPKITTALEPGQAPSDRADVVVRVYHMKLAEYLDEIKSGRAFGPIKAGTMCCCALCVVGVSHRPFVYFACKSLTYLFYFLFSPIYC